MDHDFFMQLALEEAWKYQGLTYPNPAVGAVVVGEHGEILSIGAHKRAGGAHAEVLALQEAYIALSGDKTILTCKHSSEIHTFLRQHHNNCFKKTTIYTTLEPCSHSGKTPSCAKLLVDLHVKKVVVGCKDMHAIASCGNMLLREAGIEVLQGVMAYACEALLEPFTLWQKGSCVTYKWAQRLSGTIDGGTISSKASRTMVHAMRDVSDLLIIGGNTVRKDRPTLDARMVDGRAPDILIYSRQKHFDKTIPLFNVKDREVYISDSLEIMQGYKNILVEGGPTLFKVLHTKVDRFLAFVSMSSGGTIPSIDIPSDFELLHVSKADDIRLWMKEK